mmetsp:Transcript_76351/g.134816  ORF Transcript_76351/g.134816 Transcript_76351/m.134816 type:complete len:131 (-) Transcript_76351:199-591(-)
MKDVDERLQKLESLQKMFESMKEGRSAKTESQSPQVVGWNDLMQSPRSPMQSSHPHRLLSRMADSPHSEYSQGAELPWKWALSYEMSASMSMNETFNSRPACWSLSDDIALSPCTRRPITLSGPLSASSP